jgi:cysteinyl-tRNA synthetase
LVTKGYHPLAFRYLVLNSHYRTGLDFTWEALEGGQKAYFRLLDFVRRWQEESFQEKDNKSGEKFKNRLRKSLEDNLNIPGALAVVWELTKSPLSSATKLNLIFDFDKVLGLRLKEEARKEAVIPEEVKKLVEQREELRQQKKWAEADKVRQEIEKKGWIVEDTTKGPKLKPV